MPILPHGPGADDPDRPARFAPDMDDATLIAIVQRQTLRYFWEFGHPVSGLARDRSSIERPEGLDTCAVGGTGMGVMAILVGVERGWIARAEAVSRLLVMTRFLLAADCWHGVFPHFLHGVTGRAIKFSRKDDGADLVETAYLIMGLLCARGYFDGEDETERALRRDIEQLWHEVEWSWHGRGDHNVLYWHWSPNHGWSVNFEIRGWNECLIVYVLAAASPTFGIDRRLYHKGWAAGPSFRNDREFHGVRLPLGPDLGGPLYFSQYSFMGLDPRGLVDRYADYGEQNRRHTAINLAHCVANPLGWKGYGPNCWGLTASDSVRGYVPHSPSEDLGVIAPTAAIAAMPYAPEASMAALRHFCLDLGDRIWGPHGFADAFSLHHDWVAASTMAIDQGPIVVMLENHRTGLLWRLFMSCPEIKEGLRRLGFASPWLTP